VIEEPPQRMNRGSLEEGKIPTRYHPVVHPDENRRFFFSVLHLMTGTGFRVISYCGGRETNPTGTDPALGGS
jgi:hypothetical protein